MTYTPPRMGDLADHRICNARYGEVTCYCSAIKWMTLDEYGEHIESLANECGHENVRTLRSVPPRSKCLDCGRGVERRWVATPSRPEEDIREDER